MILSSAILVLLLLGFSCERVPERPWKWCIMNTESGMCQYKLNVREDIPFSKMDKFWALPAQERLENELFIINLETQLLNCQER